MAREEKKINSFSKTENQVIKAETNDVEVKKRIILQF